MEKDEKKKDFKLLPENRVRELLDILLPYGYSHYDGTKYTGVSPYIGDLYNIITLVINDDKWGSVFSICMETPSEEANEDDLLGFYMGVMKVIAPELYSDDTTFKGTSNVLDFRLSDIGTRYTFNKRDKPEDFSVLAKKKL